MKEIFNLNKGVGSSKKEDNNKEGVKINENDQERKDFKGYRLGKIESLLERDQIEKTESYFKNMIDLLDKRVAEVGTDWISFDAGYCKSDNSFCFCDIHLTQEEEKTRIEKFGKGTGSIIGGDLWNNGFSVEERDANPLFSDPDIHLKSGKSLRDFGYFRNFEPHTVEKEVASGVPQISFYIGSVGKSLLRLNDNSLIVFQDFALENIPENKKDPEYIRLIKDKKEIEEAMNREIEKQKQKIIDLQNKINKDQEIINDRRKF
jgi:hypothetical protein